MADEIRNPSADFLQGHQLAKRIERAKRKGREEGQVEAQRELLAKLGLASMQEAEELRADLAKAKASRAGGGAAARPRNAAQEAAEEAVPIRPGESQTEWEKRLSALSDAVDKKMAAMEEAYGGKLASYEEKISRYDAKFEEMQAEKAAADYRQMWDEVGTFFERQGVKPTRVKQLVKLAQSEVADMSDEDADKIDDAWFTSWVKAQTSDADSAAYFLAKPPAAAAAGDGKPTPTEEVADKPDRRQLLEPVVEKKVEKKPATTGVEGSDRAPPATPPKSPTKNAALKASDAEFAKIKEKYKGTGAPANWVPPKDE